MHILLCALLLPTLLANLSYCQRDIWKVFDIQPGRPEDGGCDLLYKQAHTNKVDSILKLWWWQMGEMHKAAMNTLKDDDILYELEQAMAVTAFFGIQWPMDNQCHYWNPAPNSVNGLKLSRLRESIRTMWTAMITERSGSSKPKLLCGGGYMTQQFPRDPVMDAYGRFIPRNRHDPSRGHWTLGEWETMKGRGSKFQNHWYFHFALPVTDPVAPGAYTDSMYYVHPHSSEPESAGQRVPFPVDPATGSTHLCMGDADAYTLSGDFFSMGSPTEAITQNYAHLILCGEKTGGLWDQSRQYFDFKPKPTNHRLDDMELNALTLYHEFAHLAIDNEITPDATVWTRAKDARGNWHPRWPKWRDGWTNLNIAARGAMQVLNLARYEESLDNAGRVVPWPQVKTTRNPESLVWWAFTNYLQIMGGQDWTKGVVRPSEMVGTRSLDGVDGSGWNVGNRTVFEMVKES